MRVTINIDEQDSPGTESDSGRTSGQSLAVSPDPSAPPADLAARAEVLGALSAGPAPGVQQGSPGSGVPAITPGSEHEQRADLVGASGAGDLPAGAAPGQLDPSQTVGEEQ